MYVRMYVYINVFVLCLTRTMNYICFILSPQQPYIVKPASNINLADHKNDVEGLVTSIKIRTGMKIIEPVVGECTHLYQHVHTYIYMHVSMCVCLLIHGDCIHVQVKSTKRH